MVKNKIKWCPVCNQGWICIVADNLTGQLFCCCDECENEWDDPNCVEVTTCNSPRKYGQYHEAYDYEIEDAGWLNFLI